jgi:hypothetical protein
MMGSTPTLIGEIKMLIECPQCNVDIDVTDKLPERACDENEIECSCGAIFEIGWYATAEVRSFNQGSNVK